ncbi:hypothetical protein QBC34DRAFT_374989 [Podospora aff. communis PSN243]|uniref:Uncharacterized protein n=1 Tax=Podospora aff. communis PSN243 TaxID=3040156 RepID=A0AAV9H460_9PEZI|nr:hypothetical protein QBC34DRAFT_374989 [Podospora aff. communis PSN243]
MPWFSSTQNGVNPSTLAIGKQTPVYNNNSIFGSQKVTSITTNTGPSLTTIGLIGAGAGAAGSYVISRYISPAAKQTSKLGWW